MSFIQKLLFASILVAQQVSGNTFPANGAPISDTSLKTDSNKVAPIGDPADTARRIVVQMAPLVVINSKEVNQCCFPSDAQKHWQNKVLLKTDSQSFNPAALSWAAGHHPEFLGLATLLNPDQIAIPANAYITTLSKDSSLYQKSFEQVPCWCEYYWQKPYLQAKYWMFWPFNDHPNDTSLNFFDHEGDWEHIELRAKVNEDGSFKYFYYLDKHGTPDLVIPTKWENESNGTKSHPLIWAAEGSHVPYEKAGKARIAIENIGQLEQFLKKIGITSLFDNVEDSPIQWNCFDNLRFRSEEQTNPVWSYLEPWGALNLTPAIPVYGRFTDSPRGPGSRAQYANSDGKAIFP